MSRRPRRAETSPAWVRIVREPELAYGAQQGATLRTATEVYDLLRPRLCAEEIETFIAVVLNGRHRVLGLHEVSRGTVGTALVHPREVFRAAILLGGSALIIAHNHPSGDSSPSAEDAALTTRFHAAGELLGIRLLDHVIVAWESFYSFAEHGALDGRR